MPRLEAFPIAASERPVARVLLVYTGGTVGMVQRGDGPLVPMDFATLLQRLPALAALPLMLCAVEFPEPMDSSDMTPASWDLLASTIADHYDDYDAFVVLHGTDTMAFTASALSFMLEGLDKPVVLTGAQRPMTKVRSDARENLVTAVAIAAAGRVREVALYFDRLLLRGNRATKLAADRFDAFASPNHPPLARAGVEIRYDAAAATGGALPGDDRLRVRRRFAPGVTGLRLFPGMGSAAVHAVLDAPGLQGVVLEVYGAGNAPSAPWLLDALRAAVRRDVVVLAVTQCAEGSVVTSRYAAGEGLDRAGVLGGADMTFEAAITKLMLLLGEHGAARARELLPVSLAGELTVR